MFQVTFIIAFILFAYLLSSKRDVFFIFRSIGFFFIIVVISNPLFQYLSIPINSKNYTILFILLAIIIFALKYLTFRNFSFLKNKLYKKNSKDFMTLLFFLLIIILSALWYFHWNLTLPQYSSVDAAVHFRHNSALFLDKSLNSSYGFLFGGTYLIFNSLSELFFTKSSLINFQLYNIFIFSTISLYLLFLFKKSIFISNKILLFLAFLLATYGYIFNIFMMGFVPQATGLFLLLFFVDTYKEFSTRWYGILTSLCTLITITAVYIYWIPVAILFILIKNLNWLINIKKTNKKKIALLIIFLIVFAYISFRFRGVLSLLNEDGEMYKIFLANFIIFLPFTLFGIYLALNNWRHKNSSLSALFLAGLSFSFTLYLLYLLGYASAYTFVKSFYLTGPLLFYFSIYGLHFFIKKHQTFKIIKFLPVIYLVLIISLAFYPFFQNIKPSKREKNLVASLQMQNFWKINIIPMNIFYANFQTFQTQKNNLENFIYIDKEKIDFFNNIKSHIPEDQKNKFHIISDFKTSHWMLTMTGIHNENSDFWGRTMDYNQWKESPNNKYLILLDTAMTKKWIKFNKENFKFEDFNILYQEGENYLLKLK